VGLRHLIRTETGGDNYAARRLRLGLFALYDSAPSARIRARHADGTLIDCGGFKKRVKST
jgi:hypothetical protein